MAILETVRPGSVLRWNRLRFLLNNLIDFDAEVVDIGSYDGLIGHSLVSHRRAKYYAIDIDQRGLAQVKRRGLLGICGSGVNLPLASQSVDIVLLLDVIEHVYDHKKLLLEAHRVMKPSSKLILTTPIAGRKLVPWIDMHRVHRLWDHTIREGYTYQEISDLVRAAGFNIRSYTTAFNVLSRWVYYMQFLLPVARRILAQLPWFFSFVTKTEPYLTCQGLTHVFVATKS